MTITKASNGRYICFKGKDEFNFTLKELFLFSEKLRLRHSELEAALLEMEREDHDKAHFGDVNGFFMFSEKL